VIYRKKKKMEKMEENKRNKDVEKLMAHDDSARININKVSHHDRGRYINAKA
jgi:hypothetical protein